MFVRLGVSFGRYLSRAESNSVRDASKSLSYLEDLKLRLSDGLFLKSWL